MDVATWDVALLVATAVHAGFQLTVTVVVYPALAAVPADGWAEAHGRHSRRITPVVVLVYGLVALSAAGVLANGASPAALTAVVASALAVAVTGGLAAPLHGRLGPGRDGALLARLLVADRVRCLLAAVALAAAVLAVLG